jgi:hypothetical protein
VLDRKELPRPAEAGLYLVDDQPSSNAITAGRFV